MPSAGCVGSLCRAGYLLTNALLDLYAAGRPDERALTQIRRIARSNLGIIFQDLAVVDVVLRGSLLTQL